MFVLFPVPVHQPGPIGRLDGGRPALPGCSQAKLLSSLVCWSAGAAWFGLWLLKRTERLEVLAGLSLVLGLAGIFLMVELCYVRVYELAGCLVSTGIRVSGDGGAWACCFPACPRCGWTYPRPCGSS